MVEKRMKMGKLYAVLGKNDALTLVSLPDGSLNGVLFSTPDLAFDFLRLHHIPAGEVVEISSPSEYISMASAFLDANAKQAILDPTPDGVLRKEQLLDFHWLSKMEKIG